MTDPERIPVIIGVGQLNDRPASPELGLDPPGLMAAALRLAEADAGGNLLADLDSLAIVDQISFRHLGNLCAGVAGAIGANPPISYQSEAPHGDTPIRLLNEAANRIGAGEVRLAAVVGAEALRTAAGLAALAAKGEDKSYNAVRGVSTRRDPTYAQAHGLTAPVDVYPIYENAGRAAYGQTLAEAQAESGAIWAGMSEVAAANEGAWIRKAVSAEDILTPGPANRPLAYPYTKLTVANSSVNQGAGFLVASLAEARRRGIPEERLIYVGMGAAAKEDPSILRRDRYDRSTSMDTAIRRTLELNRMTAADFDHVELYSCFPCVPKMARRVLGWPVDKPATVFGGLTFGGGPIANYMSHAVVSMVERLRPKGSGGGDGKTGFLFANGGYATDNHCIVISREPVAAAQFPQDFDYQAEADAARGPIPELEKDYVGPASVESYTVFHGREGAPSAGVVIARTPEGKRTLCHIDVADAAICAFFMDGAVEPVGTAGAIALEGERRVWVR
ncbi:acetyl-CoA acetyltransferase [Novosphingobium fuchskuhlense]|uniref:Acetyl-CoA acetyltransferase n=2 Tax=Novosphingobium fuchskuhlense TaxID=1117702 RepID=A0A117UZK6_9SPHN|nr:acetyl-CoA acetyltransferase [Novosphingobium fuchskuhlense]KUR73764.1 acetyl-CoA acetyltransferase [Novosphingobium fuchskuhlense]